jgi:hypothetical protein
VVVETGGETGAGEPTRATEVAVEILCDLTDGDPTEIILCPDTAPGPRSTKGEAQVPGSDVEYIEDVFKRARSRRPFACLGSAPRYGNVTA